MDFLPKEIESYSSQFSEQENALLNELSRETHLRTTMPRMLSGHLQGRLLSLLSKMQQPQCILEIGTFTGYSALCLAEGLTTTGKLITIDTNDETMVIAKKYFAMSPHAGQIEAITGDAREIIPKLEQTPDLVFIDADKGNYLNYFNLIIGKMNSGGIIIADNVLWSGKVVAPVKENDHETKALMNFTAVASSHPRVTPLLLPIRDGLLILRVI
ncbi:MAG: O-methyltransferase [Bacteroidia bacterium]|nr:O-methyltransferase [Bacteroidia bacterium]